MPRDETRREAEWSAGGRWPWLVWPELPSSRCDVSLGAFIAPYTRIRRSRAQITLGLTGPTFGAALRPLPAYFLTVGAKRIALPGSLLALGAIAMLS